MERINQPITGIGVVDKQNGGSGQFARVEVTVAALADPNAPNEVTSTVVGAAIPTEFIASVAQGITDGLKHGPLGGYPVVGVAVTITGGKAHAVDSNAPAFREAGRLAALDALRNAQPTLLEPIALLEVLTPAEFVGAVISDMIRRRGQITDTTTLADSTAQITARVPLAETFGYATALRSLTQGRASFVLEPVGYAEAPRSVEEGAGR